MSFIHYILQACQPRKKEFLSVFYSLYIYFRLKKNTPEWYKAIRVKSFCMYQEYNMILTLIIK